MPISTFPFSSIFVQHWISDKFVRIAQWMAKAYGYAAKKKEAYKSKEVSLFFDQSHKSQIKGFSGFSAHI